MKKEDKLGLLNLLGIALLASTVGVLERAIIGILLILLALIL